MAPPAGTLRVGRYFLALLALLALLYSIVFWPGARHTPKLGLDLVGGTQVIFTAKAPHGKTPSKSSMTEAKHIMEDRVNGSGVTEATVVIQGSNRIVVSIPGGTDTDVAALGKAAVLSMRGAVMPPVGVACKSLPAGASSSGPSSTPPTSGATGSSGAAAPNGLAERPLTAPTVSPSVTPKTTSPTATATQPKASATPSASSTATPAVATCNANPLAGLKFPIPTSEAAYNKLAPADQQKLQAALHSVDCKSTSNQPDTAKSYVACDDGKTYGAVIAYLLGPVIVPGSQISGATAQAPNPSAGQTEWTVELSLKGRGQAAWAKYTGAHNLGSTTTSGGAATQCSLTTTPCADYVGFVLDGRVISAPVNESVINGQKTQITGNFSQTSANSLANQLKYGALPLSFTPEQAQSVSATLGTSQLKAGLLAGGIGLVLVVIYSLIYYRALGLVTIASLAVSGVLTYGCLVLLGTQIGFTLSLAGIAGFIVAVGITADSFVVFFERIKDEVHDGRSVRVAIPRAWVRARRTILSADTVSFLAAAILYYFAAGDVKGFAFTLGLSTILDLAVVFLFTHPVISVLSRSRAFASARFTGLNAVRDGGVAIAAAGPSRRETEAVKPSRAARRSAAKSAPAAVAVLERDDPDTDVEPVEDEYLPDEDVAEVPDLATESDAAESDAAESDADVDGDTGDGIERRRTTPAPGSAAERAAARRAKLRAEKGKN